MDMDISHCGNVYVDKTDLTFYSDDTINELSISRNDNLILFPHYSIEKLNLELAEKYEFEKLKKINNISGKYKDLKIRDMMLKLKYDIDNFKTEKFKPIFIKWAEENNIPIRL